MVEQEFESLPVVATYQSCAQQHEHRFSRGICGYVDIIWLCCFWCRNRNLIGIFFPV